MYTPYFENCFQMFTNSRIYLQILYHDNSNKLLPGSSFESVCVIFVVFCIDGCLLSMIGVTSVGPPMFADV